MIKELYNKVIKESKTTCDLRANQMVFSLGTIVFSCSALLVVFGLYGLCLVLFTEYGDILGSVFSDYSKSKVEAMFINTNISIINLEAIKVWVALSLLLRVVGTVVLILLFPPLVLVSICRILNKPVIKNKFEKIKQKTCRPIDIKEHLL